MLTQFERKQIQAREEREIKELNELVKVRLAPSKIHGVGVFALRNLKKGEKLYADIMPMGFLLRYTSFDKLRPEVRDILLEQFPNIVNGSHFGWPTTKIQAFMNFSFKPNYSPMTDKLLEDVPKDCEIFEDYRMILNYAKIYPWIKDLKEE